MINSAGTTNGSAELKTLLSLFFAAVMRHDTDTLLRFLKRAELTLPLLCVLGVVERRGAVSIREIGDSLDYSLANASLIVDKLVCQGCVTRVENVRDRRHKLVQLTPKGQALLAELREVRADNIGQQLLLLPPDLLTQTLELLSAITDELSLPETHCATEIVSAAAE